MNKIIVKATFDFRDVSKLSNRYDAYITKTVQIAKASRFFDPAAKGTPVEFDRFVEDGEARFKFSMMHFGGGNIELKDVKQGVSLTIDGIFGSDEFKVGACLLAARLIIWGVKKVKLEYAGCNESDKDIVELILSERDRVIRTQNTISENETILTEKKVAENKAESSLNCS